VHAYLTVLKRGIALVCVSLNIAHAQYTEPKGGLFPANIVFFQDEVRSGITVSNWASQPSVDRTIKRNGAASWRWTLQPYGGISLIWGGWGMDTTVFWANQNSRLQFWIRPGARDLRFQIQVGYLDGQYDVISVREIGPINQWTLYDEPLPAAAIRRPLNVVKITFSQPGTFHIDDLQLTNVRLYAGMGEAQSITGIFADQIGYDTFGYKTFSSEKYNSYKIVRVSDNKVMYVGTDRRTVTHRAIGDYSVHIGNFTAFETPGTYVIQLDNGKKSYPFEIGPTVYAATLRAAIRFFYYQRNNSAIVMPYAEGPWVHEKDEKELVLLPRSMGGTKLVRKGWHDAGDLSIYMPNHTYACYWLAAAWEDFPFTSDNLNIPESANGIPDLLDELRWGLDWILDMQDPKDGGFFQNMCVNKNSPYEYGKTTALTITGYELTNKATAGTAAATAVLAYASRIFSDPKLDPAYAAKMRSAAIQGWKWLEKHPQQILITENCNTYQDDSDIHARVFAAAALFLLTGEERYHRYFLMNDPKSYWFSDYNNQTNMAYLLYLKAPNGAPQKQAELRNLLVSRAAETNADRDKHPFGFVGQYYWGSLGTSFARVGNYNLLDWKLNRNLQSLFTAQQQLHYTFGQNSLNFVYFSGFGKNGMRNAFHHWLKALNATPFTFPGLLPGGPQENPAPNDISYPPKTYGYWGDPKNPRDANTPIDQRYTDNDSWSTNEIAVNQSAQLVYVLCAAHAYATEKK
jgi:endoglucanase